MVSDLPLACLNCAQRQVYAARELFTEKPVALSQIQPLQQRAGALFDFFRGDLVAHGTNQTLRLGRPAFARCMRLPTSNAAVLFSLVKKHGFKNTQIVVQN